MFRRAETRSITQTMESRPKLHFGALGFKSLRLLAGISVLICQNATGQSASPPTSMAPRLIQVQWKVMEKKFISGERASPPPIPQSLFETQSDKGGVVRIQAIISTDGVVRDMKVVSGYFDMGVSAAEAVRTWRFEPTQVDGAPVEVETILPVIFPPRGDDVEKRLNSSRRTSEKHPNDAIAHGALGLEAWDYGEMQEAIREFRRAIELRPKEADYHIGLGRSLRGVGDFDGAIAAYREGLSLKYADPSFGRFLLADALAENGDLDGAIEEYRRVIAKSALWAGDAHNSIGLLLVKKGDWGGAIGEYRASVHEDRNSSQQHANPNSSEIHFNLGTALEHQGDLVGALSEFRSAAKLEPKAIMYQSAVERVSRELKQ